LLVAGDKEVEAGTLAVRDRSGKDLGVMSLDAFENLMMRDMNRRGRIA